MQFSHRHVSHPWPALRAVLFLYALAMPCAFSQQQVLQRFTVTERLGYDWTHELVTVDLSSRAQKAAADRLTVFGPDGTARACQFVDDPAGGKLAFLADLPAHSAVEYQLVAGDGTQPATDVWVDETDDVIRLGTKTIGIAIRKRLSDEQGPLAGIRLRSGEWVGDSRLILANAIGAYEAKVTASGPVFGEAVVSVRQDSGAAWEMRLRVIAGEPVIVVDETFSLSDGAAWTLKLTPNLQPNHGIFRTGWYRPQQWPTHALYARSLFDAERKRDPFVLLPWINWSDGHQVSCVSLYREDDIAKFSQHKEERRLVRSLPAGDSADAGGDRRDVLFFAAGEAGNWARPGKDWGPNLGVPLKAEDGQAALHFQLNAPARHWMLGSAELSGTLVPDRDLTTAERYAIKHCGTSLQDVLDMTLVWGGDEAAELYPRLGFTDNAAASEPEAVRRRKAEQALASVDPARLFLEHVRFWDTKNGQHIRSHDPRVWTHTICRLGFLPGVDWTLGSGTLTESEFGRLRARLAFMAHKFGSPDFYSYERGWRANPNMTTTRYALVGLMGCLLGDHPKAGEWYDLGVTEVRRQLDEWVGPNGGWLESPHYQSLLGDGVMLLYAAYQSGLSEEIFHPNLLATILYLAKISTPPDPRFGNLRHLPPVGNTYRYETSGFFGILSKLYRDRRPDAAEALQWMWLQQGTPMWTGIGGGSYIGNVMNALVDHDWTDVTAPAWGSEVFPNSGTILRAHFPGARETRMYVLHGKFNQHYDNDRGSFTLWGKGQPLCLDWGYVQPYSPDMHNMLTSGQGVGRVARFHTSAAADYLHVDCGPWQRQIMFAKSRLPGRPNFFVVRDASASDGSWHQWFNSARPLAVEGDLVQMSGNGDVSLDVWMAGSRASEFPRMTQSEATAAFQDARDLLAEAEDATAIAADTGRTYLRTRDVSKVCPEGIVGSGSNRKGTLFQRGLSLPVKQGMPVMAVYYPRLKSDSPPVFTELAEGRGVKIVSQHGTDYVFLGAEPFEYREGEVEFQGVAGTIRLRDDGNVITLGAGGTISYGNASLTSETAAERRFE